MSVIDILAGIGELAKFRFGDCDGFGSQWMDDGVMIDMKHGANTTRESQGALLWRLFA